MRAIVRTLILLGAAGALLAVAIVGSGPPGAVDWRALRAVALESDDWGLQGFIPDAAAWDGLDREALTPGRFPPVYWGSTLEDSAMVADLCAMLDGMRGADGLPAVFQPNYVLSALRWDPEAPDASPIRYDLPNLAPEYERPGLWHAVTGGIKRGVWYPEFHATWHFDPDMRRSAVAGDEVARQAAERGILLFPGGEKARELGAWRSRAELAAELDGSLDRFQHLFGRSPGSIIAPDYTWNAAVEDLWQDRGLTVIQAKREQRNPAWGGGWRGRGVKFLARHFDRYRHPGRIYLERNCRLEPVQHPDPASAARICLAEVRRAWERGQPAVVETHRVNFAHTDSAVVRAGRQAFAAFLSELAAAADPPLFLTDREISQLQRAGTSWVRRGSRLVVRNVGRSRKVVAVPADVWPGGAGADSKPGAAEVVLLAVDGGETVILPPCPF